MRVPVALWLGAAAVLGCSESCSSSVASLLPAGSGSIDSAGVANARRPVSLAIIRQGDGAMSGMPFTQQSIVELRDTRNRPVLQAGIIVTVGKAAGAGVLTGTLSARTDTLGRATFAGLQIFGTGTYTLIFTSPSLASVTTTISVAAPPPPAAPTLRALANSRGFAIGAAVRDAPFASDAQYKQLIATQYNSIVPEDATDFWPIHPDSGRYDFAAADALVDFATARGMEFHGHHLAWYSWIPTWVTAGGKTDAQIRQILKDHITTVVGRYRGRAKSWDVVNEAISDSACFANNCQMRSSVWLDHLGPEYIDSAFVWAHRADPMAKLYLNEFRTETIMNKSDAVLALAKALRARGVPIDGVGFQVHILPQYFTTPTSAQVQANLQRFADAGFDIRITEMDVQVPDNGGASELVKQAAVYSAFLDACLKVARCKELTTWGVSDRFSWVPASFPGYGRALPFDSSYRAKPAFDSLLARLGRP